MLEKIRNFKLTKKRILIFLGIVVGIAAISLIFYVSPLRKNIKENRSEKKQETNEKEEYGYVKVGDVTLFEGGEYLNITGELSPKEYTLTTEFQEVIFVELVAWNQFKVMDKKTNEEMVVTLADCECPDILFSKDFEEECLAYMQRKVYENEHMYLQRDGEQVFVWTERPSNPYDKNDTIKCNFSCMMIYSGYAVVGSDSMYHTWSQSLQEYAYKNQKGLWNDEGLRSVYEKQKESDN